MTQSNFFPELISLSFFFFTFKAVKTTIEVSLDKHKTAVEFLRLPIPFNNQLQLRILITTSIQILDSVRNTA